MKSSTIAFRILILTLLSMIVTNIYAQNSFLKHSFIDNNDTLSFNLLFPTGYNQREIDKSNATKYPLILFLHGAGERGNDNEVQIKHIKDLFLDSVNRKTYPAFVIAPQCPKEQQWVNLKWSEINHKMPENSSKALALVSKLLDEIINKYPVDPSRVYICGLSMGGYGTWDFLSRYPGKFAAAVPICGGGDISKACLFKNVPIWAFHGDADKVVPVKNTRDMIKAIKNCGGNPKYTEYSKVGHDSWVNAFKEKDLLEWIFNQKK